MRYFITFACYGGHLHGDESGSVDRNHNLPGGRLLEADPDRVAAERQSMTQAQYLLDRDSRAVVLQALLEARGLFAPWLGPLGRPCADQSCARSRGS